MSRWPNVALGELLAKSDDWIPLDPEHEYMEVTVRNRGQGATLRRIVAGAEISGTRRMRVHHDQFIVSRIDARHGSTAVIPSALEGAIVTNDFPAFDCDEQVLRPDYLGWYSKTAQFVDECRHASEGSTNRVRLKEAAFLDITMPLPPIEEQRRVAEKLDRLARGSTRIVGLCGAVDAEAAAIVPAVSRRLIDAGSWTWLALEEACSDLIDYRGRTPPISDSGIPHLTSANIRGGRIDWRTSKYVSEATYRDYMTRGIPRPGDVLFTMEAPLGEAAVLNESRRFSLAQRTLLLRTRPEVLSGQFLAWSLASPRVRESIFSQATGTTVKGIASKRLKRIPIPVPPLAEQARICALLNSLRRLELDDSVRRGARRVLAQSLMSAGLQRIFRHS